MQDITPSDFQQKVAGGDTLTLLDIREPWEIELARVDGAVHIPMGEIPGRLGELDRDRPVVVMCHHGVRSRQVALFLEQNGFQQVLNLAGGIDAWSVEVDPDVASY